MLKVFSRDERYAAIEEEVLEDVRKGVKFTMCEFAERMENQGIQKGIQKGIQLGITQGRDEGDLLRLIKQIHNFLLTKIDSPEIWAALDDDSALIERIRQAICSSAPEFDPEAILKMI